MKKVSLLVLILLSLAANGAYSNDEQAYGNFKTELDSFDKTIYDKEFKYNYALKWWAISDKFVLDVFNNLLLAKEPHEYFKERNNTEMFGIKIKVWETNQVSFKYDAWRPDTYEGKEPFRQEIEIGITTLDLKRSLYYVDYERNWNEHPYNFYSDPGLNMGTFRLIEKDKLTGKYQIITKQEDTNFQRNIVLSGKFKYLTDDIIEPYCWLPELKYESIERSDNEIKLNILYYIQYGRQSEGSSLLVSWLYSPGKKLRATEYTYSTSDKEGDANWQLPEMKNQPVKIAP